MPRPLSRLLATLVAASLLSCHGDDDPAPITGLAWPAEARALAIVRPAPGDVGVLLAVKPDGSVQPVDTLGEAVKIPIWSGRWLPVRNPVPRHLVPLSDDRFVVGYGGGDDPRNEPDAAYARWAALVRRDGPLEVILWWVDPEAPELQGDGAGQLYFADLPSVSSLGRLAGPVWRLGFDAGAWRLAGALSPDVDVVRSYVVDLDGNLAYRADRADGRLQPHVIGFAPAAGDLVLWDDVGPLGTLFRAADGRIHLTRGLGDDAGTTELLRVDFGPEPATRVSSWIGAPGGLLGEPLAIGEARAFVRANEVVLLAADGTPAVYPLAFVHRRVRASAGALWFVAEDGAGAPTRAVRWQAGAAEDLLPAGVYDVEDVAPYSDDAALAGVIRRSDGERSILRAVAGGEVEPVETGIAEPLLADALLLP